MGAASTGNGGFGFGGGQNGGYTIPIQGALAIGQQIRRATAPTASRGRPRQHPRGSISPTPPPTATATFGGNGDVGGSSGQGNGSETAPASPA
jgi:hypothetical protein